MLVVDASVALKWVLQEAGSEAAHALRGEDMVAPSLWLAEAANTLWALAKRERLSWPQATARRDELRSAPLAGLPFEDEVAPAMDLGRRLDHPVYDCLYLALAFRLDCQLVTADERFFAAAWSHSDLRSRIRRLA